VEALSGEQVELVRAYALRLADRLHVTDVDAVVGDALLGLAAAADTYRPGRGVPFIAYAFQRVRWAVLDGLRESSGYGGSFRDVRPLLPLSLDAPPSASGESLLELAEQVGALDPGYIRVEERQLTDTYLARMGDRERYVVVETVLHGRTLADVGAELGVTAARCSQLRFAAYRHARDEPATPLLPPILPPLTPGETRSLALIAGGHTAPSAARAASLSVWTIRTQLRKAIRKLGARNVTEAVAMAIRQGLFP
jgi:RNA polymerase sigma factor (sigma-70 family)